MKRRIVRVSAAAPLEDLLAAELRVSSSDARELVDAGSVYVGGRRRRDAGSVVAPGEVVMVILEESGTPTTGPREAAALRVLHEDADVLAVDKPPGVTAQPTPGRLGDSLLDLASAHLGRGAGLVHRLDRETSGVTIFGKHAEATSALAAQFRAGTAHKRYLAVACGALEERGAIDLPLSRDPSRIGRWRATRAANGLTAVTRFERLGGAGGFQLVACFPETGRTHQIRAHLAAAGAPIAGDALYGGPKEVDGLPARRCLLHAEALELRHPRTGAPLRVAAPIPEDLRPYFERAGVSAEPADRPPG